MLRQQNAEMLRSASDNFTGIVRKLTLFFRQYPDATELFEKFSLTLGPAQQKNSEKTKIFSEFFWNMSESFGYISDVLGE